MPLDVYPNNERKSVKCLYRVRCNVLKAFCSAIVAQLTCKFENFCVSS